MFFEIPRFHSGGETIHADGFHEEWGGKGFNQAVAAARQDAAVTFLGAVNASDAKPLRDFCAKEGIRTILATKKNPTACAAILTDATGETRVTVYRGAELEPADVDCGFGEMIAAADILLLNNEVPEAVNLRASEIAESHGVKIVFNPAPARPLPEALKRRAFLWTPNEFEERALGDVPGEVVTTLGAKGCRIRSTGAGDTFTAVLAVRLAEGESLRGACAAANAAAAKSVERKYVLPSLPFRGEMAV